MDDWRSAKPAETSNSEPEEKGHSLDRPLSHPVPDGECTTPLDVLTLLRDRRAAYAGGVLLLVLLAWALWPKADEPPPPIVMTPKMDLKVVEPPNLRKLKPAEAKPSEKSVENPAIAKPAAKPKEQIPPPKLTPAERKDADALVKALKEEYAPPAKQPNKQQPKPKLVHVQQGDLVESGEQLSGKRIGQWIVHDGSWNIVCEKTYGTGKLAGVLDGPVKYTMRGVAGAWTGQYRGGVRAGEWVYDGQSADGQAHQRTIRTWNEDGEQYKDQTVLQGPFGVRNYRDENWQKSTSKPPKFAGE